MEDGGVFLVENAVPDLGGQVGGGSFCARQNHEPGYHPIQTVDGTKILLPQCLPAQVGQTAGFIRGQHARGLMQTTKAGSMWMILKSVMAKPHFIVTYSLAQEKSFCNGLLFCKILI